MSIASEVNYSKIPYSRPMYRLTKLTQQTGGTSVPLTSAGGPDTIFELPVKVFNLARSSLNFTITPAAAAVLANYMFQDCVAPIQQIQLYTRGNTYLCDINNVNNYTKIVNKPETKLDDFLTYPIFMHTAEDNAPGQYLCRNNTLQSSVTNTKILPYGIRHDNSNSDVAYTEPKYLQPATDAANATPVLNIQLPLYMIKNSILALNKDIYANEILLLRVVWASSFKIIFGATDEANPAAGAANFDNVGGNMTISNLNLYLALQANEDLALQVRNEVMTKGMSVLIPYVWAFKNNPGASTSHTIDIRLTRNNGIRCQKIYLSAFHATEGANTMYDHNNVTYNTNADSSKVGSFYTQLDGNRLQDINMNTGTFDDYMMLKDKLKNSVIQSKNMFYYNWFWLEDFTGAENKALYEYDNLETGLDLSQERKWSFNALAVRDNATATAYNYYTFAICQRLLSIGPQGLLVT